MRAAFTLVELLIIVVILGILAAIVTPNLAGATEPARQGSFVFELKYFVDQAEIFRAKTGQYLPDGSSGVLPAGFEDYVDAEDWENGTPVGGVWDAERNDSGVTAAIGVHFNGQGSTRDAAYMTEVDRMFDNGDVQTGLFRRLAGDRYYYVMAE